MISSYVNIQLMSLGLIATVIRQREVYFIATFGDFHQHSQCLSNVTSIRLEESLVCVNLFPLMWSLLSNKWPFHFHFHFHL